MPGSINQILLAQVNRTSLSINLYFDRLIKNALFWNAIFAWFTTANTFERLPERPRIVLGIEKIERHGNIN